MAFRKKQYDDDDGRVIADMSDIEPQPLIIPRFDHFGKSERRDMGQEAEAEAEAARFNAQHPEYQTQYTAEERRALIGGSVAAALLILGIVFAAFALVIFLITKIG